MRFSIGMIALLIMLFSFGFADDNSTLPPGDKHPPTIFERISEAGEVEDFDSASYIFVLDSIVNRINRKGVAFTDMYMLYKILTDEGCNSQSVLTWHYEPMSSMVEISQVRIIRGDSAINVPLDGLLDLPAPQSGIYWSDRLKMLQLPRLEVNDGIEVISFRKGYSYALLDNDDEEDGRYVPPMPGEYFDIVLFQGYTPIVEKKYILKMPADKRIHSQVYNGTMYNSVTYNQDTTTYAWWMKDIEALPEERFSADLTDIVPKVVVATVESWEAKSRWFFDVNESQFEYTDAIKAKVDEIFERAGVTNGSEEQKAFELVHWVAQNIRYSGQTMGEGEGFTLHSGEMIFEQRSGVCKDIAGMLVTMMRAAGMDSHAAMTMAGSRIEKVPADQFNHCVVALKKSDGSFVMYDPTWVPFDNDIWSLFEAEQDYLIGSQEGHGLNRIRYSPPEESPMNVINTARLLPDGTIEGTMEFHADGAMDYYMRGLKAWFPVREQDNMLATLFSKISNRVEILDYTHGDIYDFHTPMWWKINYRIPQYAMPVENGLEFRSPLLMITMNNRFIFRGGGYDWPEERETEMFQYATQLLDGTEVIDLPKGYSIIDAKDSKEIDETYAYFKADSEAKKGKFEVKEIAKLKRRQVPVEGYPGFYKAMKEGKDFSETIFRAEKGGAK
jgi:hypothetical protein